MSIIVGSDTLHGFSQRVLRGISHQNSNRDPYQMPISIRTPIRQTGFSTPAEIKAWNPDNDPEPVRRIPRLHCIDARAREKLEGQVSAI